MNKIDLSNKSKDYLSGFLEGFKVDTTIRSLSKNSETEIITLT